jgi:hypothetical protein
VEKLGECDTWEQWERVTCGKHGRVRSSPNGLRTLEVGEEQLPHLGSRLGGLRRLITVDTS